MYTHDDMNNRRHISTHSHIHIKHNYCTQKDIGYSGYYEYR